MRARTSRARLTARLTAPLLLVAAVMAGGSWIFVARAAAPSDGTVVALSDRLPRSNLVISAVLDPASALRSGDVVIAIDGSPVDRLASVSPPQVGEVHRYTVRRDGAVLQVPVSLTRWPGTEWVRRNWSALLFAGSLLTMAVLVFRRRPSDPAAATLLAVAALNTVGVPAFLLGGQVIDLALQRRGPCLGFGESCLAVGWAAWLLFVLLFPHPAGEVPAKRIVAVWAALLSTVFACYLLVAIPSAPSLAVAEWRLIAASFVPGYVFPALIVLVVAIRFWRARGTPSRRYLSWLLRAFVFGALSYYLVWQLPVALHGAPLVSWELVPFAFLPCVATLAGAVLRFGLFDIKAVARRSLVYATLTASIVATYVGIVAALGSLFTSGPWLAPPLMATVMIAVLFQPLKDRVQRGVSRLLYGSRDEPYLALSRLGERLETTGAGSAVLLTIASAIASALRMPYAAVELCAADGTILRTAEVGLRQARQACIALPAVAGGELAGRLLVAPHPPATEFGESELRLLTDLTRQAAPALQALQLNVELKRSRERLLRARAEERRRIQRDLHDGIGPSLAGLRMQIGAARALLEEGAHASAKSVLDEVERQVADCSTDVRQLLVALRSPLLDSLGLIGALHYQAKRLAVDGKPSIIVNTPPNLSDLPAAVEEATLAIVSEAMTNSVRHASAEHCTVTINLNGALEVIVCDDGRGISWPRSSGIGLHSMRQRAADIGGDFAIASAPAGGTEVRATLPLAAQS